MKKNLFHFATISGIIIVTIFWLNSSLSAQTQSGKDVPGIELKENSYIIGSNDILQIFVWKEPDLSLDVTVLPSGSISFPLIGEIIAQGKTVMELKNIITEKLKDYISVPEVTVIVAQSRSRRVYTIGKVNRPGPYPLEQDMTVLQALSTAGGFAEWAETKYILIVRRKEGKDVLFRFNYDEFISGKNLEQNVKLESNDTIVVP